MSKKDYCKKRRSFLKTLAVMGTAAVALPAATERVDKPAAAGSGVRTVESQGYKETEHIRKYYRSAAL